MLVALGGFFLQSTLPVNVTFGQALAPVSAATVSSLMMGFAWGSGGLTVPIVGRIADLAGLDATLRGLALVPLAAAALALLLPPRPSDHVPTRRAGGPALTEPRGTIVSLLARRSMSRYASRPATLHYSFGPGPMTPAVKWLIIANVAMFVATLDLRPASFSISGFPPSW